MPLPNLEEALIEEQKITEYLLSEDNSGGKKGFFTGFGFLLNEWQLLRDALFNHAKANEVTKVVESEHGIKYIIEGEMQTPDGRSTQVRAIWIIDTGKDAPRLVTSYPLKGTQS